MARTYTRAEIRARAAKYARLPPLTTATTVTVTDADDYINVAYAELWEMLMDAGLGYFAPAQQGYTTDGITGSLTLPATAARVHTVVYVRDANTIIPLQRVTLEEAFAHGYDVSANIAEVFALVGDTVTLIPRPASGKSYAVYYYAAPSKFTADADTIDGVSGWEDFIARQVAIQMMDKMQTDATGQIIERDRIVARIEDQRLRRVQSAPAGRIKNTDATTRRRYPWA